MTDASVRLWGREIGAVSWLKDRGYAVFQYAPEFVGSGIQLSPLEMPLREAPYQFPGLAKDTFHGLPGLLADSLPDRFGQAVIDTWLASQSRSPASLNPVERLCYIGTRGMGALEFQPALFGRRSGSRVVELESLVKLANIVLRERSGLEGQLSGEDDRPALEEILRVGTSAGGARAKAVLSWNPETGEFRSGQLDLETGFEPWLLKFDGVVGNRDREVTDPRGYGRIEFAYHLMATEAGITMSECRLHEEGGRAHFMTRRFDRTASGARLHMLSLSAMRHFDYNRPDIYSYEQALETVMRLRLGQPALDELYRRAVFNVVARNQDDHVKNIAYLMGPDGTWSLAPAFDVAYSYNPSGAWTGQHQMSLNGKRDNFYPSDLMALAEAGRVKRPRARGIIDEILASVDRWAEWAEVAGVEEPRVERIEKTFRRGLAGSD